MQDVSSGFLVYTLGATCSPQVWGELVEWASLGLVECRVILQMCLRSLIRLPWTSQRERSGQQSCHSAGLKEANCHTSERDSARKGAWLLKQRPPILQSQAVKCVNSSAACHRALSFPMRTLMMASDAVTLVAG